MAGYFQLLDKNTGEAVAFNALDEELCRHFEQPIDPEQYLAGWYNAIGFRVATGKTLDEVRAQFQEYIDKDDHVQYYTDLISILDYIAERYQTHAWYSRG